MPHRVLVLGNTGMLGHMVEHVLATDSRFEIHAPSREEFDVLRSENGARGRTSGVEAGGRTPEVEEARSAGKTSGVEEPASMLKSARPSLDALLVSTDYVINCIGITARHMDDADAGSVARAIRVNAEFPHALAAAAQAHGVRVIHMSTDGVFSGRATIPYTEDAMLDAMDTYGRTKTLGESRASSILNIRASIIGPSPYKHEGLWEWVASQPSGATVDGYTNYLWHGVTTMQFAEFCRRVIAENRFDALRSGGAVLHLAPNAPVTKADLVVAIVAALGKRLTVRPIAHTQPIHRILSMRPDVAEMLGTGGSIIEALRACAVIHARSPRP